MSIERSTNIELRKSPRFSATAYPKGFNMVGNDGGVWEIIIDSRGTHRWQKVKNVSLSDKTDKDIELMKILIAENPSYKADIQMKMSKKLVGLEILGEEDEESKKSAEIIKRFLRESFSHGGKIHKLHNKEKIYEKALMNSRNKFDKIYFAKKLTQLDEQKTKFN
jgi:hypothetical protein